MRLLCISCKGTVMEAPTPFPDEIVPPSKCERASIYTQVNIVSSHPHFTLKKLNFLQINMP